MVFLHDIFTVCGGISIALGLIYLFVTYRLNFEKKYLYFSVFSVFAGIYYFLAMRDVESIVNPVLNERMLIFTAAVYYGIFPWFIGEYTKIKYQRWQWILSFTFVLAYILFLAIPSGSVMRPSWQISAYAGTLGIVFYGLWCGRSFYQDNKGSGAVFLISFLLMLILTLDEIFTTYAGVGLFTNFQLEFLPLDFYPMFFILIMTGDLTNELLQKFHMERALSKSERKWTILMDHINLIVVELDMEGHIRYINPFYEKLTGYEVSRVWGKNWYDLMLPEEERGLIKGSTKTKPDIFLPHYKNHIVTISGEQKMIHWSSIYLVNDKGERISSISIGLDYTQQEEYVEEIHNLKLKLEAENIFLKDEMVLNFDFNEITGKSDTLKYALYRIEQVAPTDTTVLLEGETGVGKELFARAIHATSKRNKLPLLKVNCSSMPANLIESELFGHEKGAFTGADRMRPGRFEVANKGTLFLDEIGELPLELQPKLLRILEEGAFERLGSNTTRNTDVRIIAATNRDLIKEVENGRFREDLYYRLNTFQVSIPPLRKRKEDIPLLVDTFVQMFNKKLGKKIDKISKHTLKLLEEYDWPGNIRELRNVIERSVITNSGSVLRIDENLISPEGSSARDTSMESLEAVERKHIVKVLKACKWRIEGEKGAARILDLHPNTLRNRMKKLKIERPN
jgi:PAS domain S-box-containing protein